MLCNCGVRAKADRPVGLEKHAQNGEEIAGRKVVMQAGRPGGVDGRSPRMRAFYHG